MKCGYNCNGISKSMKNMVFHGLVGHGWDYFITELLSIKKGNSTTLMKDKPSQAQIFNGTQWSITFSDVQDQIFKK
jgi:hypothetical protein